MLSNPLGQDSDRTSRNGFSLFHNAWESIGWEGLLGAEIHLGVSPHIHLGVDAGCRLGLPLCGLLVLPTLSHTMAASGGGRPVSLAAQDCQDE